MLHRKLFSAAIVMLFISVQQASAATLTVLRFRLSVVGKGTKSSLTMNPWALASKAQVLDDKLVHLWLQHPEATGLPLKDVPEAYCSVAKSANEFIESEYRKSSSSLKAHFHKCIPSMGNHILIEQSGIWFWNDQATGIRFVDCTDSLLAGKTMKLTTEKGSFNQKIATFDAIKIATEVYGPSLDSVRRDLGDYHQLRNFSKLVDCALTVRKLIFRWATYGELVHQNANFSLMKFRLSPEQERTIRDTVREVASEQGIDLVVDSNQIWSDSQKMSSDTMDLTGQISQKMRSVVPRP